MELTERKLRILQAIIDDFVFSAEPIGSRTLSKKYELGISPATIRNEMADLEEMGYLTHPHTSAGRVPSDKAYRLYVDSLMQRAPVPEVQQAAIRSRLNENLSELNKTIERAATLLSEITNLTAFALTPKEDTNRLKYINLLPVDERSVVLMIVTETGKVSNTVLRLKTGYDARKLEILSKMLTYNYRGKELSSILTVDIIKSVEVDIEAMSGLMENIMPEFLRTLEKMLDTELYMEGLTNIFNIPEYNDIDKARMFMGMLNKKERISKVLDERADGIMITIGEENTDDEMKDCSLITATYRVNGKFIGKLGVIGPTRMKYDKVTSLIEFMTDNLSSTFKIAEDTDEEY
ncbi:MAG: heat-inducible transcription repressor HrcA [Firmicutes bacterium]|nr:heat-inducible transcription repressor HrcA [Bacillota bacterium]MBR6700925.1 heat-inducible transcription repressor HrcA [Bacillota bacterium]